jgi:hypothetical protein
MAFTEIDRVNLYWPKHAMQKMRTDCRRNHQSSSKTSPSAKTEILEGGCTLYRLSNVVEATGRSTN